MNKQQFQTSKEPTWRNHLARHAERGKSIAALCRDEAISPANLHVWRTKLSNGTNERAAASTSTSTFIDTFAVSLRFDGTALADQTPSLLSRGIRTET